MSSPERWFLSHDGVAHVVTIEDKGLGRRLSWSVEGEEVAAKKTSDERVVLAHGDHGAVFVQLPALVGPARRVSWWPVGDDAEVRAYTGLGGTDFDPEPGSRAAEREAWIREHPRQYALRRGLTAAAGILVPLLLVGLLARIPWPDIPWPEIPWPEIPWPDWRLPWPEIPWPEIPWPDWSLPALPAWVERVVSVLKYVFPVLLAVFLARGEVRRRRRQDQAKRVATQSSHPEHGSTTCPPPSTEHEGDP